jgi:hypothetical protein
VEEEGIEPSFPDASGKLPKLPRVAAPVLTNGLKLPFLIIN